MLKLNRLILFFFLSLSALTTQSFAAAPACDNAFLCVNNDPTVSPAPTATGYNAIALGAGTSATGGDSLAIGTYALAANIKSNAVGAHSQAQGVSSNALGNYAQATSDGATALGDQAYAGDSAYPSGSGIAGAQVAIGSQSSAMGGQSIAIGMMASVSTGTQLSTALGYMASATASNCLALGSGAVCNESNTAAFANARLVNIQGGINPYDAVAMYQLQAMASVFGGGTGFFGGNLSSTSFYVYDPSTNTTSPYATVFDAFNAVNSSLQFLTNQSPTPGPAGPAGTPGQTGPQGPVGPQGPAGGTNPLAVHYDNSSQASVTLSGTPSTDGGLTGGTTVTNVHQGAVSSNSTDAVNGTQLYDTQQQVSASIQTSENWARTYTDFKAQQTLAQANSYTDFKVGELSRRMNAIGALGASQANAAASLAGIDSRLKNRWATGVGEMGGMHADTIMFQHVNESGNQAFNASVSFSQGGGTSIGVGYAVGY